MLRKLRAAGAAICLLALAMVAPVYGQRTVEAPPSGKASPTSGSAVTTKKEVVTLAITGLDRLLSDINYLSTAAESPQGGLIFGSMAATFTQGLDRARPMGLVLYMNDNVPAPILILPVTDLNQFVKGLEAFVPPPDVDSDGVLNLKVGNNLVFVRDNKNGWAFASQSREALDLAPADPMAVLGPLTKEHDLHVALNVQAIPAALRQQLMNQMQAGFEQTLNAQPGNDAGKEMSRQAARQQLDTLKRMIDQSETLQIGWTINPNEKYTGFDIRTTAAEGTEIAQMNAELQVAPSRFSSFIQPDAAVFAHASVKYGPLTKKQSLEQINAVPLQLKGVLDNAVDEGKINKDARDFIDGLVQELLVISKEAVDKGYTDMGLVVRTDNDTLGVAVGLSPISGPKVEQLAAKLKEKASEKARDVEIKLNAKTYKGVNLHTVEIPIPDGEAGPRKVFGSKVQLLLGTAPDALYIGLGPDGSARVQAAIDGAAEGPRSVPNQIPSQFQLSVLPLLEYAQSLNGNPVVEMVLQKLREYPDLSEISIRSKIIPRGSEVQLRIEEGLLHAAGTAAQAARQQPQF